MTTLATNGYQIGDRYTLLGKLGEGGESEVWRARDHLQSREVALKILRPEIASQPGSWAALERQHEISRQLENPLILRVDPPVRDGDVVALPMELAPGGDLRRLCGVSYLEIVPVLMEVTQALAHAHARGIVHRDLKPGNVLFDARGHVRLTDFGAAPSALSPFTASPQQLTGEPATVADDIYGLGALAYELLSGHPPFYPRFDPRRVLEEPVPPLKPAHLAPGRLVSLVMSMLAKQPRQRPASMQEVLETLDMALNDTLTFAYDDRPAALASPQDTWPAAAPREEAEPPVSSPPAVVRPAAPERSAAPARPPIPERPAIRERAAAPAPAGRRERPASLDTPSVPERSAPERPAAPAPRPPLITPAPQAAPLAAARPSVASPPSASAFWESGAVPPQSAPAPSRPTPEPAPDPGTQARAAAPAPAPIRAERAPEPDLRALWGDIRVERVPNLMKLEPVRRSRWPWVFAAGVAVAAIAAFVVRHDLVSEPSWVKPSVDQLRALTPPAIERAVRSAVEAPLHARQNGTFPAHGADAASSAAQSQPQPGASNAPPPSGAASDLPRATAQAPPPVRPRAMSARTAGSRARAARRVAGEAETRQAPEAAGPSEAVPQAVAQSAGAGPGIEPLLADARAAESAHDFSRAAQDYSQALALDPRNAAARAGLDRANAAFGAGEYSQAVGAGFAALGAGRLEEAREDFQHALGIEPGGSEGALGLTEVAAALRTRDAAAARYRARSDLESRLQALLDDPQQLDSAPVRAEAASLIREAEEMPSSGAVMRSLAARLAILLPAYDKPVHLALVSDNLTEIEIPQIGSFGTFSRREIDLKPGKYTVIGTRAGYREVRRDVTIAPGQSPQIISVRCQVPI